MKEEVKKSVQFLASKINSNCLFVMDDVLRVMVAIRIIEQNDASEYAKKVFDSTKDSIKSHSEQMRKQ